MIKDYRFKDIEKYLKKDKDIGKDILEAFESLSDAAAIFSPIIFGPQFLPMLELLDVKDRLFSLGHKIYDFIAEKIELDYIDRTEQIRAAYALICYTAYFDVLQNTIPANVRKKLKLKFEKKKELLEEAKEEPENTQILSTALDVHCNVYYADHVTSFSDIKEQLVLVYERVTRNLVKLISESSIFDEEKNKDKQELERIKKKLELLPKKAIEEYEAQYLKLADQFNDFALFAQLQNFEGIHHAIEKNRTALELLTNYTKKIDVGLSNLNSIVNSIATNYSTIQAQDIVDDLKRKYLASIEEPIIDDKEIKSDTENISIRFPKIVDAFIPQSYKCLSYQRKDTKLEDASVWSQFPVKDDLHKFFVKYLYSPDSIDYPLIILGQPGSGKSLLTRVLSAQLMSNSYTVIRIPLREVNAEDGIDVLVEDQIKKVTNRPLSLQGYGGFATQFNEKPLIIILDGYDELLQAKGDVFSGYLEKVRTFQQDQKSMKRPVRIIITSRITLIDKARIPEHSTILRLMEFNSQQRQAWINIWNNINADYFANSNIRPFSLPAKEKGKKNNIIELAEQPLLLLMLALYDSEANELAQKSNIKRTDLYDNLLRRFVRRERRRYVPGFIDKTPDEQEEIIDQEMNRLGVVAIGMYNRQEVVILSKQLEEDLDTFSARRSDGSPKAHTLKESESVLGGFFFIHKSTAQDIDAHSDNSESAYEFLHNTFGEFLAADFILRNTINEVKDIFVDRKFKFAGLQNKLSNPDSLNAGWFYCLMFVPLYSRPVVVEMLREHAIKALQRALKIYNLPIAFTQEDFIDNLKYLVNNQLKMVLNTRNTPSVMRGGVLLNQDIPLLGYLSTYSLNLVILACVLSSEGFEFNEEVFLQTEESALDSRPWDKVISLWKAWFSPADLMGLSVILKARRNGRVISIKCNDKFEATRYEQPMDILLCVSHTLGDDLLTGLAGVQTQRFCEITRMKSEDVCEMLREENPDLYLSYFISLLRIEINGLIDERLDIREYVLNCRIINRMIELIIHDEKIYDVNSDTLLNLFEVFEYCIMRKTVFLSIRKEIIKMLSHMFEQQKFYMTKVNKFPEVTSAVRLMRLLTKGTAFLLLEQYDEPIFRNNMYIGGEWSDEIERFMHLTSYYDKNSTYIFQMHEESNNFEIILLNMIDRMTTTNKKERKYVLDPLLTRESMDILIETNPDLLSRIIISLLENDEMPRREIDRIINIFLGGCLNQFQIIGINYLQFNTIINAISIARHSDTTWYLNEFQNMLRYELYGKHPRFFVYMVYLNPKFILDLTRVIPEIFDGFVFDMWEFRLPKKEFMHLNPEKWIYYVGVYRFFYELCDRKRHSGGRVPRELHMFVQMLREFDKERTINIEQLTLQQVKDLKWYADITRNEYLLKRIDEVLQQ